MSATEGEMLHVPADAGYCVYSHVINGETIYVGKGRPVRAFSKASRNVLWLRKTKDKNYEVNILGWYASEVDALAVEKDLILMLRPSCNILHNDSVIDDVAWQAEQLKDGAFDGKSFLVKYFEGPINLVRMVASYGFGEIPYETASKWFQRGRISASWFPQLLCVLEFEHGEGVSMIEFFVAPGPKS